MSDLEEETKTIAAEVWFDDLDFCGCGNPEIVLTRIRDVLRAIANRSAAWRGMPIMPLSNESDHSEYAKEQLAKTLGPDQALEYLMLYVLDAADLTEHGGSVGGSWLTPKGEELLAFLESHEEGEWMGEPLTYGRQ